MCRITIFENWVVPGLGEISFGILDLYTPFVFRQDAVSFGLYVANIFQALFIKLQISWSFMLRFQSLICHLRFYVALCLVFERLNQLGFGHFFLDCLFSRIEKLIFMMEILNMRGRQHLLFHLSLWIQKGLLSNLHVYQLLFFSFLLLLQMLLGDRVRPVVELVVQLSLLKFEICLALHLFFVTRLHNSWVVPHILFWIWFVHTLHFHTCAPVVAAEEILLGLRRILKIYFEMRLVEELRAASFIWCFTLEQFVTSRPVLRWKEISVLCRIVRKICGYYRLCVHQILRWFDQIVELTLFGELPVHDVLDFVLELVIYDVRLFSHTLRGYQLA